MTRCRSVEHAAKLAVTTKASWERIAGTEAYELRCRRMSEAKRGRPSPNRGKKFPSLVGNKNAAGNVPWNKGIPMSDETRKKLAAAKRANPTRYWLGKKRSPETIKKVSEARRGLIPWNKSRTCPQLAGENHWNWKGGDKTRHSSLFKAHLSPKLRENALCTNCRSEADLIVHHIDHDKHNDIEENLRVLCRGCHARVHAAEQKLYKLEMDILNGGPQIPHVYEEGL